MIGKMVTPSRTLSIIAIILGFWLLFSPFILNYSLDAAAGQTVIGFIVVAVAGFRFSLPTIRWPNWVNVVLGIELLIIPFNVTTHGAAIYWNMVLTGLVLIGISAWSGSLHPLFMHHSTHPRHHVHGSM